MANNPIHPFNSCSEFLMAMDRFNPYIHSHSHSFLIPQGSPIHWPFRVFSSEACLVRVVLGITLAPQIHTVCFDSLSSSIAESNACDLLIIVFFTQIVCFLPVALYCPRHSPCHPFT